MALQCREFRRAVGGIRQRSVQEWEAACSGMHSRERQTALGFVWFHSLFRDTPEEGRRLGSLSEGSGCIAPFSPSEYAGILGRAGFPVAACAVVEKAQESLDRQTAVVNEGRNKRRGK